VEHLQAEDAPAVAPTHRSRLLGRSVRSSGLGVQWHFNSVSVANRTDSRERQVADCSRTIRTTAAELGIPIIVLAQLNGDGRSRESRAIEQDSNVFAIIEETDGRHYLNLKYTRSCPSVRMPLTFRKEYARFESRFAEEARS
jgi:replicative DNA helicase